MPSEMTVNITPDSERAALTTMLEAQRVGLIRKVEDISDSVARRRPTVSSLSLLGLIKHSTTWEHRWFDVLVAGQQSPDGWPEIEPEPVDVDLITDESDTVAQWISAYRAQIQKSDAIIASTDLDARIARSDIIDCNLRYVAFHMIEETARHAGHADIIRETLDGSRGI